MENRLQFKNVRHTFIVLLIVLLETTHCQKILDNRDKFSLCENGYGMGMKLRRLEADVNELTKSLRESGTEIQMLSKKLDYIVSIQSKSELVTTRQVTQTETAEEIVNRRIDKLDDKLNALEIKTTNLINNLLNRMEQAADSSKGTMNRLDQLENTVEEIVNRRLDQTEGKLNELDASTTKSMNELVNRIEQTSVSTNGTMYRIDRLENTMLELVAVTNESIRGAFEGMLAKADHKSNELANYTECMFEAVSSRLYDVEKKVCEIEFDTCASNIDNSSKGQVKFNEPKSENGSRKGVYGRSDETTGKCDKSRPDSTYRRIERMEEWQKELASNVNKSYQEIASLETELLNNKADVSSFIIDTNDELSDIGSTLNNLAKRPGGTYVRWGKTSCPSATATLVYTGSTAGKKYDLYGSGTNILCLHNNPIAGRYTWGTQIDRGKIYGGKIGKSIYARSLPCAVCRTKTSGTTLMVPGRNLCMAGWNKEYSGRLMSSQDNEYGATEYICVDSNPDRGHSSRSQHFRLFDVEARCGTLKCPPYVDGQEITCVVCSSQT